MKTIFIVITRGFIVRNILRLGFLDALLAKGFKIVIILPNNKNKSLPEDFTSEMKSKNVEIELVDQVKPRRLWRAMLGWVYSYSLYTESSKLYFILGNDKQLDSGFLRKKIGMMINWILAHLSFLHLYLRFCERFFITTAYDHLFEKYKPAAVFSTSIISGLDVDFMKVARRRGLKNIAMIKGWDNTHKQLYRILPDLFITPNLVIADELVKLQKMKRNTIVPAGFLQFDVYKNFNYKTSREDYWRRRGLDPNKRIIFFGSEGAWTNGDKEIAKTIYNWITSGELKDCQLLIRPHFSNVFKNKYADFVGLPGVVVDDIGTSDFFSDCWCPNREKIEDFLYSIKYSNVMIAIASTLTLDAACVDLPVINIMFGAHKNSDNVDMTEDLYKTNHYQWVLGTNAPDLARNENELLRQIKDNLEHPERKKEERKKLVEVLCLGNDGQACEISANAIKDLLE